MQYGGWCMLVIAVVSATVAAVRIPDTGANAASRACTEFGLALQPISPSRPRQGVVILSRGALSPQWNATCATSGGGQCDGLFHVDAYEDDMVFEYMFRDASLYDFGGPVLTARGGRAMPQVEDYSTDVEQGTGEIRVWHRCAHLSERAVEERAALFRGDARRLREMDVSTVTMRLRLRAGAALTVAWRKTCGHGAHRHIDYGIEVRDSARSLRAAARGAKVGPEAVSTRVFLRATGGVAAPHFLRPAVSAAAEGPGALPVVVPLVRGWERDAGGAWFNVLYGCERLGVGVVSAEVALPPFRNVSLRWEKDCGGGVETSLRVSAALGAARARAVVIAHGRAARAFDRDAPPADANTAPHAALSVAFQVAARDGTAIGPPSASSNDGRIVRAEILGSLRDGGVLSPAEQRIEIRVRCRKVGDARVTVTVPVVDRVAAEWVFYKRCFGLQRLRKRRHSVAVLGAAAGVLGLVYVLQRVVHAVPQKSGLRFAKVTRLE